MKAKVKTDKRTNQTEKIKSWIGPVSSCIATSVTAFVAIYGVHHQTQTEETNIRLEHEKWDKSFAAQVGLANANRQADFLLWQQQLLQLHTNWILERNIEWSNQLAIWRQQRSEEWTQQFATVQTQETKSKLAEKESLYQDVVFHLQRVVDLHKNLTWNEWWLFCDSDVEIPIPKHSSTADIERIQEGLDNDTTRCGNNVEKLQIQLADERDEIYRLMQSVKQKYSEAIATPADVALFELDKIQGGIQDSPEMDNQIKNIFHNNTNAWYDARNYYVNNIRKLTKPEKFEKAWLVVAVMMEREISLDQKGISAKPEYLTGKGPFVLDNGSKLTFSTDLPENVYSDIFNTTNNLINTDKP